MKTSQLRRALLFVLICCLTANAVDAKKREYYEWRYYTANDGKASQLDDYLKNTLIPAYERLGIKVGAFTHAIDSMPEQQRKAYDGKPEQRILLFVYESLEEFDAVKQKIWEDREFRESAQSFFDASAANPAYSNFQSHLCIAFTGFPEMINPNKGERLFELRTYWSPNEEANQRKVKMFNKDELTVFDLAGINDLCYGEVLSGPRMPAMIYLTSYRNLSERKKQWDTFRKHPEWIRIKDLPEYRHTATNNTVELVIAMPYSKI